MTASNRETLISRKQMNKEIAKESARFPDQLRRLRSDEIGKHKPGSKPPVEVWRSSKFLVQVYDLGPEMERLSVCRTKIDLGSGRWVDKITWDDLQKLKRECGRGDLDALEVYPSDKDIVNVANMRHLWVCKDSKLSFAWRTKS